jgi:hypothetical protein
MCFPKTLAPTITALGVFLCLAGPLTGEEGVLAITSPVFTLRLSISLPINPGSRLELVTSSTPGAPVAVRRGRSAGGYNELRETKIAKS